MQYKLAIIVRAYKRYKNLPVLLHSFLCQTDPDWVMYVIHDGPDDKHKELMTPYLETNKNIHYFQSEKRYNDWGHSLTSWALNDLVQNETHVLFTNDDNYYMPVFVEYTKNAFRSKRDIVMTVYDCIHDKAAHHNQNKSTYGYFVSLLRRANIDLGAFVTTMEVAREVGFNSRDREADADFVESVIKRYPNQERYFKLNHTLFVHN